MKSKNISTLNNNDIKCKQQFQDFTTTKLAIVTPTTERMLIESTEASTLLPSCSRTVFVVSSNANNSNELNDNINDIEKQIQRKTVLHYNDTLHISSSINEFHGIHSWSSFIVYTMSVMPYSRNIVDDNTTLLCTQPSSSSTSFQLLPALTSSFLPCSSTNQLNKDKKHCRQATSLYSLPFLPIMKCPTRNDKIRKPNITRTTTVNNDKSNCKYQLWLKPRHKNQNRQQQQQLQVFNDFFKIESLIRKAKHLSKWVLLILLFNIFSTTTTTRTASASTMTQKFSIDERRIVRNLFLKKFGLENLAREIERSERHSLASKQNSLLNLPTRIPKYIWELYEHAENTNEIDTIRHYYPTQWEQQFIDNAPNKLEFKAIFNLRDAVDRRPDKERTLNADLRISRKNLLEYFFGDSDLSQIYGEVIIKEFSHIAAPNVTYRPIQSKILKYNMEWLDFDVTKYFLMKELKDDVIEFVVEFIPFTGTNNTRRNTNQRNANSSKEIVALMLSIANIDNFNKFIINKYQPNYSPFSTTARQKRSVAKFHKKRKHLKPSIPKENNECRKTELYVDFAELNWQDWIMAPIGYEAYQCRGKCSHPLSSNLNTTNHAIIQSLINSIDPSAVPQPSCVPVEMSAISILYRDINNVVVVKTYPDMRVEACGCH